MDLEWLSPDEIIVARAKENKEWKMGPVPTMFTKLYIINIQSGEQKQLTFPPNYEIDDTPQVIGATITWYRKRDKENQGDVWIKNGVNNLEQQWLTNVDSSPTFFHKK